MNITPVIITMAPAVAEVNGIISTTTLIKITLMLLCFGLAFVVGLLYIEITKVKKAIAIMCAASPELTAKINKLMKPIKLEEDEVK